jgi:hypothetical protein
VKEASVVERIAQAIYEENLRRMAAWGISLSEAQRRDIARAAISELRAMIDEALAVR